MESNYNRSANCPVKNYANVISAKFTSFVLCQVQRQTHGEMTYRNSREMNNCY